MVIIAKTNDGVLISATDREVIEILSSVTGKTIEKLEIGQKIPAIDYASSIIKIKELGKEYRFKSLKENVEYFSASFKELEKTIMNAASIEI
jgi:hypothetical protein